LDAARDASQASANPWDQFLRMLKLAEDFHDQLGLKQHPHTFCLRGTGHHSADVIEMQLESNWVRSDPYPARGFRGFFTRGRPARRGHTVLALIVLGGGVLELAGCRDSNRHGTAASEQSTMNGNAQCIGRFQFTAPPSFAVTGRSQSIYRFDVRTNPMPPSGP